MAMSGSLRDFKDSRRDAWDRHPGIDLLLTLLVISTHLLLVYAWRVPDIIGAADPGQRVAIYGAGTGAMSLIAGFTGNAIAQYGTAPGAVAQQIRSRFGLTIRKNWSSIIRWLLTSVILCIIAMIAGSGKTSNDSEWIFEFALLISIGKFCRLVYLFRLVMSVTDFESGRPAPKTPRLIVTHKNQGEQK
jgi:hypothetical protein